MHVIYKSLIGNSYVPRLVPYPRIAICYLFAISLRRGRSSKTSSTAEALSHWKGGRLIVRTPIGLKFPFAEYRLSSIIVFLKLSLPRWWLRTCRFLSDAVAICYIITSLLILPEQQKATRPANLYSIYRPVSGNWSSALLSYTYASNLEFHFLNPQDTCSYTSSIVTVLQGRGILPPSHYQ